MKKDKSDGGKGTSTNGCMEVNLAHATTRINKESKPRIPKNHSFEGGKHRGEGGNPKP